MQVGLNIHEQYFNSYLGIIVLLYADDTVLFAESEQEFKQEAMAALGRSPEYHWNQII